ncbi:MAG: metalloregulator ArsR/SmtB family transcription factor [bacterium]|nr:metalloregulator ArsR/SmtB family transcription factor [bacterium]
MLDKLGQSSIFARMNSRQDPAEQPLERIFRALSERIRLRILFLLAEGEMCVGDIVRALMLPQAKVSQHLGYLSRAGLVQMRRSGLWRYYRLANDGSVGPRLLLPALLQSRSLVPEAAADGQRLLDLKTTGGCCPR